MLGLLVSALISASSLTKVDTSIFEKKLTDVGLGVASAIPEPGVWSSLFEGLFVLGLIALRRRAE